MEKTIKCPYCGGNMLLDNSPDKIVCDYCDEEIIFEKKREEKIPESGAESDKETVELATDTQAPAERLFSIYADSFDEEGLETWELLCTCLNAEYSLDKYIDLLERMASNNSDNMTTPNLNNSLYKTVSKRISSYIIPGERIMYYKDSGIFVTGKTGMLITSLKVYFLEKKNISHINLKDIKSIHHSFMGNYWYINNEKAVDSLNCTAPQLGIVLACILHMAKSFHTDEYKIGVYQK